jgi:hypothetical protein
LFENFAKFFYEIQVLRKEKFGVGLAYSGQVTSFCFASKSKAGGLGIGGKEMVQVTLD